MTLPLLDEPSLSDSWDALPPSEDAIEIPEAEQREDVDVKHGVICPTCDEPIIKEPGTRGRTPKFHAGCRPLTSVGGTAKRTGGSAKQRDAAKICEHFRKQMTKGLVMLAAVDQYSAFAVMVQLPTFFAQFEAVLVKHDKWRAELLLAVEGSGSVIGMAITVLMMLLPIAAHHKLIPGKKIGALLENLPKAVYKLSQRLKDGEEHLTRMMAEQMEGAQDGGKEPNANPA